MKKIAKANSNRISITKTFSSRHELHGNTNTDKSASSTNSIKKIDTSEEPKEKQIKLRALFNFKVNLFCPR